VLGGFFIMAGCNNKATTHVHNLTKPTQRRLPKNKKEAAANKNSHITPYAIKHFFIGRGRLLPALITLS
jgi:hypothetical protein